MNKAFYRFCIFNLCGFVLVAWGLMSGKMSGILHSHTMTYVIIAAFLVGLASATHRMWRVTHGDTKAHRNSHLFDFIEVVMLLGIVGNSLGFIDGLMGMTGEALSSPETARVAVGQALTGAAMAFNATFVSCSLTVWTIFNCRMVESAANEQV